MHGFGSALLCHLRNINIGEHGTIYHGKLGCVYAVTITAMSILLLSEGRKLSCPRHFKMKNGLCRLLFSTKKMLPWHI